MCIAPLCVPICVCAMLCLYNNTVCILRINLPKCCPCPLASATATGLSSG